MSNAPGDDDPETSPPAGADGGAPRPTDGADDAEIASFEEEKTAPELRLRARKEEQKPVAIIALLDGRRRRAMVEALWGDGWNALEAADVEELLEMAQTVGPQMVLVDPELRGPDAPLPELLRHHRQESAMRVVAIVPDDHDPDAIRRALAEGYDDFVAEGADEVLLRSRAAANLRAARIVAQLNKQRRDAALLLELTQTLASSLDMQLILHTVSRLVAEVLGLERCSIILLDPNDDDAIMVAASEDRTVRDLRIKLENYPELKRCVETAAPVLVLDVTTDPLLQNLAKSLVERGVRTQALFPIVFEEGVTGVLFLRSSKASIKLGEHEVQFGQTVAAACATAIRNARLFDQFRDENQQIETMRAQAERQNEALKKYQDFFEYAADGIAVIDVDGRIHYANKEGRRLLGRTRDELKALRFPSLLVSESARLWPELVAQVRHGRFKRSFDVYVLVGDEERVFSLSAGGVGQGTGLLILSFRDVTEMREMEGELRTTKEFLENLIDNSVDAIVAADMNGNIMLFNKGAERIYGYRAEEVIGVMHVSQLYPEGGAAEVMRRLRDERWGGRGRLAPERREILTASGDAVPVSMSASIIYEDGEEVATVGVFTDLRDRMAIERQLSEARDQLTKAEKARVAAELAGMAAHELNQPLTSVLGYAEMLKARIPESDVRLRRPVETIFKQAERMAEIVRKIGRITKYETKRYGANTDMIDLNRAIDDVPRTDPGATKTADDIPVVPDAAPGEGAIPRRSTPAFIDRRAVPRDPSPEASSPIPPPSMGEGGTVAAPQRLAEGERPRPEKLLAALVAKPNRLDAPADPRAAVVRMDTVDAEPAGYVRKLQQQRITPNPDGSGSASSPTTRPPMRAVALDAVVPGAGESDEHTNPGVRISELKGSKD